uniref:Si:dkey-205h13.2 n=1 Tax=Acanthochromis polyacanthus TaxID=80966 RepID=A0A3Q1GSN4_9TELE
MDSQISWQVSLHCPHRKCVTGLFFLSSVSLGAFILFHLPSNHRVMKFLLSLVFTYHHRLLNQRVERFACKTAWFDEGNVSREGDSELLTDLRRKHQMRICSDPVDIEAQTVSGIKVQYSASEGLLCLNSEQKSKQCDDFKVKFTCTGQFCSECRTDWFDHDDPTLNGDYEVLSDLLSIYPRQICPQPIAIEVQTIYGEPASNTSDNFLNYDATYGFACVNAAQGRRSCGDYKVRFTCPKEFCQGKCLYFSLRYQRHAGLIK